MELRWNNVGSWPMVAKVALISFSCLLSSMIGYYFSVQPKWQQLVANKKEISKMRLSLTKQPQQQENIKKLQKKMDVLKLQLQQADKKIIQDSSKGKIMAVIYRAAANSKVRVDFIQPTKKLQIQVQGDYFALIDFVHTINALPYLFTISMMTLKVNADNDSIITMLVDMS